MEPIEALRQHGANGPKLLTVEAHLLSFLHHGQRPSTAFAWLVGTALLALAMLVACITSAWDAAALASRGQVATAVVERVNDVNPPTANVVFETGPAGAKALLEPAREQWRVGQSVDVLYDPQKPTRARDAGAPVWRPEDWGWLLFAALLTWLASITYRWWIWLSARLGPNPGRRQPRHG